MSNLLEAFLELRSAIFAAYAAIAENACAVGTEYERRRSALSGIDEILDGQPLASFSAAHLKLLELMLAYWREAEVEGEIRPPSPDTIH
jgi:alkylation response protein AidB-like acyl-CoA dehydrogenase